MRAPNHIPNYSRVYFCGTPSSSSRITLDSCSIAQTGASFAPTAVRKFLIAMLPSISGSLLALASWYAWRHSCNQARGLIVLRSTYLRASRYLIYTVFCTLIEEGAKSRLSSRTSSCRVICSRNTSAVITNERSCPSTDLFTQLKTF